MNKYTFGLVNSAPDLDINSEKKLGIFGFFEMKLYDNALLMLENIIR